ncbi:MAG: hypothetical protein R3B93_28235 [Bacteroidia bacterium]
MKNPSILSPGFLLFLISIISLFSFSCQSSGNTESTSYPVKDGTYTYEIFFAEWNGRFKGPDCKVIIEDGIITVVHIEGLSREKGEIIAEGLLQKHVATGKWIIAESEEDIHAEEIGGCTGGPVIVNFKKKMIEIC